MRYLSLFFILFSGLCFAQPETQNTQPNTTVNDNVNPQWAQLKTLNTEIAQLQKEAITLTGTAQNVVRLQLLTKNETLRDTIQSLLNETPLINKSELLAQVRQQVQFINKAEKYLNNQTINNQKVFEKANNEEKLITQKNLSESHQLAIKMLKEQWINYQWLNKLDINVKNEQAKLIKETQHKLNFTSASLKFNTEQENQLAQQLKSVSGSEKAQLQLAHILATRNVAANINTLQFLVQLGDEMKIDTSNYKKQLFESTGNVTNDLLDRRVMWSLISNWFNDSGTWLLKNTPQVLFKIFIFGFIIFIARKLKNVTCHMVRRAVSGKHLRMSQLMQDFFISMSGKAVFFIGLLIALAQVGLDLTPILTGFGVAGVVIGFALQDTLSNFASGMMLLIYRPFDVGDFVEAGGVSGKVSHMSLVNTTIKTFDNQIIIVPNKSIWGDTIKNVTHERVRRVDMVFGIGYQDSVEKAEVVLNEIVSAHPLVLKSPETTIKLHVLNSSSVDFIVRPWVKTEDYWDVYWDITREVKLRFDKEGISIPFPQQDVHLHWADGQIPNISVANNRK